jgi:hypothetical protein
VNSELDMYACIFLILTPGFNGIVLQVVDTFSERQTLNKNRGGALCTGADGPRAGPDDPRPGARRGGTLCAGADCPWPGVRLGLLCLTAGRSARTQRRRESLTAPGSRSREGSRRGGEILGGV